MPSSGKDLKRVLSLSVTSPDPVAPLSRGAAEVPGGLRAAGRQADRRMLCTQICLLMQRAWSEKRAQALTLLLGAELLSTSVPQGAWGPWGVCLSWCCVPADAGSGGIPPRLRGREC